MAKNERNNSQHTPDGAYRHVRKDPITGQVNYFFPLEITEENEETMKLLAQERGLEICRTLLGRRFILAVMVPCKDVATIHGIEVFVDTPEEVQKARYHELMKDELAAQDAEKQDSRCQIPDGRGKVKRCSCRVPNPDYSPDGDTRKTLAVSCEGCPYENFRPGRSTINFSDLDGEDENGEEEWFEAPATKDIMEAARFLQMREDFIAFVEEHDSKLVSLAELRTLGYGNSEISRMLSTPTSTVSSRSAKLMDLLIEFLETI